MSSAFALCVFDQAQLRVARDIGRIAVQSLYAELVLYPKPGLVSLRDNGAHDDMNAATFMRSLFALRHYFRDIAVAGMKAAPMADLRRLGLAAESNMMHATMGVNTHRGAIFALGLVCAAAGRAWAEDLTYSDAALRATIAKHWRRDLLAVPVMDDCSPSHGLQAMARYGVDGARGEAVHGFPSVFEVALPALRRALAQRLSEERAQLHAFFELVANVADTNVLHRGGRDALDRLQASAAEFIAAGSTFTDDWFSRAEALHLQCSHDRISAGGCADLLSAAWFVHRLQNSSGEKRAVAFHRRLSSN